MTRTPITVRVARWSATHPWRALGLWLGLIVVAMVLSGAVAPRTATATDMAAGSSQRALRMLDEAGREEPPSELVLVTPPASADDDAAALDPLRPRPPWPTCAPAWPPSPRSRAWATSSGPTTAGPPCCR